MHKNTRRAKEGEHELIFSFEISLFFFLVWPNVGEEKKRDKNIVFSLSLSPLYNIWFTEIMDHFIVFLK